MTIQLANRPSVEAEEVAPGMVVDFDAEGRVVGIEFADASALDTAEVEINGLQALKVVAASAASEHD